MPADKAIRLFAAMPLGDDLRRQATRIQDQLKRAGGGVKWVEPGNLHITLKFLGWTDEGRIPGVVEAMRAATQGREPFQVEVKGVGAFPNARRPRVIWLGTTDGAVALAGIAERLESEVAALGFERETRPFAAHVTLGRVSSPERACSLTAEIELMGATEVGKMTCGEIVLMRSDLSRSGPTYTPIEVVRLGS